MCGHRSLVLSVVEFVHVAREVLLPPVFGDAEDVDHTSTVRITMRCVEDGSFAEFNRLVDSQILSVSGVEHSVGVRRTTADGEAIALQSSAVVVDVVQSGAGVRERELMRNEAQN